MPISVSYCLFSQPLLVVIGFYSHEQWLCLFGSFEPWLSRPTYIYGSGDNLFYAYPCTSVQSLHRLFMRGPMHSALAEMHCFWELGLFLFLIRWMNQIYGENLYSCPTSTATKNLGWHFILSFWVVFFLINFISTLNCIPAFLITYFYRLSIGHVS